MVANPTKSKKGKEKLKKMESYDSDDEGPQYNKLHNVNIQKGMFVSGWDDDADDLIEEDKNPQASIQRMILWSVNENKIAVIREILSRDSDAVLAVDSDGYTPLHRACYNNFVDIAKLLLQYNANPNAETNMGWTPLHSACKWSNVECVQLLLQHGSNVNASSEGQQTPLHVAASVSNSRNTVTILLMDPHIDALALNNSEETAAHIARRSGLTFPIFEMGQAAFKCESGLIN